MSARASIQKAPGFFLRAREHPRFIAALQGEQFCTARWKSAKRIFSTSQTQAGPPLTKTVGD